MARAIKLPDVRQRLRRLGTLSDPHLDWLARGLSVEQFPRGVILYSPGDTSQLLYLLLTGILKDSIPLPDGRSVIVNFLKPGEFFGHSALFKKVNRFSRAEAFTDITVGIMTRDHLMAALSDIPPPALLELVDLVGQAWLRALQRYVHFLTCSLPQRLATVLIELADGFGVRDVRGVTIDMHLTHALLADAIGHSRPSTSLALKTFERQGVIGHQGGKVVIYRIDRLSALASGSTRT